jgi:hypothetical protein
MMVILSLLILRKLLKVDYAAHLDFFESFIDPLEVALDTKA